MGQKEEVEPQGCNQRRSKRGKRMVNNNGETMEKQETKTKRERQENEETERHTERGGDQTNLVTREMRQICRGIN